MDINEVNKIWKRHDYFSSELRLPGQRWVVVIGIDDYLPSAEHGVVPLKGAVVDAMAFEKTLIDKFGFKQLIKPLYNERAHKDSGFFELWQALSNKGKIRPEDQLVIYFAGHGILTKEERNASFWLPYLQDERHYKENQFFVDHKTVQDKIFACPACQVLLISDSCFSGGLIKRDISPSGEPVFREQISDIGQFLGKTKTRAILTSGGREEKVIDSYHGHSIFCSQLLDLLDRYEGPFLPFDNLTCGLLAERVRQATTELGMEQSPVFGFLHDPVARSDTVPFLFHNTRAATKEEKPGERPRKPSPIVTEPVPPPIPTGLLKKSVASLFLLVCVAGAVALFKDNFPPSLQPGLPSGRNVGELVLQGKPVDTAVGLAGLSAQIGAGWCPQNGSELFNRLFDVDGGRKSILPVSTSSELPGFIRAYTQHCAAGVSIPRFNKNDITADNKTDDFFYLPMMAEQGQFVEATSGKLLASGSGWLDELTTRAKQNTIRCATAAPQLFDLLRVMEKTGNLRAKKGVYKKLSRYYNRSCGPKVAWYGGLDVGSDTSTSTSAGAVFYFADVGKSGVYVDAATGKHLASGMDYLAGLEKNLTKGALCSSSLEDLSANILFLQKSGHLKPGQSQKLAGTVAAWYMQSCGEQP